MTGKERILTCLSLGQPDTVPTFTKGIDPVATLAIARELQAGVAQMDVDLSHPPTVDDNDRLVDLFMLVHDELDIDGYAARDFASWYWCYGFDIVDELHIKDAWGIVYRRNRDGIPVPVHHPVKAIGDLRGLPPTIGMGAVTANVRRAAARFGDRKALVGDVLGPYYAASWLRGTAEFLMDLVARPDLAHALMRFATDAAKERISEFSDIGAVAMVISDDVAHKNGTFMSPSHVREFIAPYHRELVDLGHSYNMKMILHCDGNIWKILDDVVACGFDGLNPLEPEAGMDLATVKARYGDRLCLIGNLSIVSLLTTGTPAEVEAEVIRAIGDAGAGGGLVICDSNVITSEVRAQNYIAMMRAAKTHGRYA